MGQNEIRACGQHYDYIVKQIATSSRKAYNDAGSMASVSKTLSEEDVDTWVTTRRLVLRPPVRVPL